MKIVIGDKVIELEGYVESINITAPVEQYITYKNSHTGEEKRILTQVLPGTAHVIIQLTKPVEDGKVRKCCGRCVQYPGDTWDVCVCAIEGCCKNEEARGPSLPEKHVGQGDIKEEKST